MKKVTLKQLSKETQQLLAEAAAAGGLVVEDEEGQARRRVYVQSARFDLTLTFINQVYTQSPNACCHCEASAASKLASGMDE